MEWNNISKMAVLEFPMPILSLKHPLEQPSTCIYKKYLQKT